MFSHLQGANADAHNLERKVHTDEPIIDTHNLCVLDNVIFTILEHFRALCAKCTFLDNSEFLILYMECIAPNNQNVHHYLLLLPSMVFKTKVQCFLKIKYI